MPMMAAKRSNRENKRKAGELAAITTSTCPSCIILDLPTELLVKILTYLPVTDLFSVWRTCRTLGDIIAGTAYLQYIIHAYRNGVEDSLPPDYPYSERLELLRRREQSWSGLRFDLFTECVINMSYPHHSILQDGYLIYANLGAISQQYGYTDVYSAVRNEELHWVHIKMDNSRFHIFYELTFAVDHNLVVGSRFVPLPIPIWEQNLTEVIANSESEAMMLSGYSLPFSNSQLVYFILSHQHMLCRFHHFLGAALSLCA
jgi:hypothetical protein